MTDRQKPKASAKNDAEALKWFKDQHNAPCGGSDCDSVYCYIAERVARLTTAITPEEIERAWHFMEGESRGQWMPFTRSALGELLSNFIAGRTPSELPQQRQEKE